MTGEQFAPTRLFVVDCYDDSGRSGTPVANPRVPVGARLAYVVRVPADDLLQALVEGSDEQSVRDALTAVGWRVDRITPAVWASPDRLPAGLEDRGSHNEDVEKVSHLAGSPVE